ncbi:MAG TPA: SlyX family protein [Polyangiaceae bacterium]
MVRSDESDARFLKLEEKVAYQEKTIADLDGVVVDLRAQLEALQVRLESVERTLRQELAGREMPNERPPHY